MTNELSKLEQQIQKFMPFNEQEEHDKAILLKWIELSLIHISEPTRLE